MAKKISTYFSDKLLLSMITIWSIIAYLSYDLTLNNISQLQLTIFHIIVWFLGLISLVYFMISRQKKIKIDRQIQIERKKIQNAQNLAEIEQLAHIGSWNFDVLSNKLTWSDEVYRIFGLEPQELDVTYDFFLDAVYPEDREFINNAYYTSINEGRDGYEIEHRIIQKGSGNTRLVYEKCLHVRNSAGEIISLKGMVKDITEPKQARLKLLESESRFRSYFELGLVGMAVTSIDKIWLDFNDTLCNMLGYSREEFSQLTWMDLTHPDDIELNLTQFNRVIIGEINGYSLEKRYIHSNGSIVHTLISVKAVRKIDGIVEQFVALVLDITDRKYAEDELLKARKLESVGLLAGGIAHDFNNILSGLFGNIELAKQKLSTDNAAYTHIKKAENTLDRATNLTQQLLTFAKGGDPLIDRVNIEQVIQGSIKFSLSGNNVKTILILPENLWHVKADKGQLSQVITNLAINADQSMSTGGTLTFEAENIKNVSKGIDPNLSGEVVKLSIKDDGAGISAEHLKQIFDPYFTTRQTGSGLGLATVHSIIKKHNGHIGVVSESGIGTIFTIHLPADSSQPQTTDTTSSESTDKVSSLSGNILVMDDDEMILEFATEMIRSFGYTVATAVDGKEALEKYISAKQSGQPFNVVIMDLTIHGGMGGEEAVREILIFDPEAKTIVSSGYSTGPVMANYSEYGFKDRLVKPFQMEELQKKLSNLIKHG
ncbi:MAG: PAS domain S-box protein [Gammaproteobacteria bacterium]|nr:PAS domain S-box protein [Gammaproteobacteria bacterium]